MSGYTNIVKLIEAIANAWTKSLPMPYGTGEYSAVVDGQTDCNRYVNDVASQLGYKKFWNDHLGRAILADEIVAYLILHTDEWTDVAGDVAQSHANNGALVIAGWSNPEGHGHVSIVRPGFPEASGSWGILDLKIPKVANVGEPAMCRWDRKASFAFGKEHVPKYYVLKAMVP